MTALLFGASNLRLLYHNDLHKGWHSMPRLASAVQQFTQNSPAPVLQANTGDSAGGTQARHQRWMTWVLNKLGVQVATLGNHEFDITPQELTQVLQQSRYPTVVNNLTGVEALPLADTQVINGTGVVGLTRHGDKWSLPKTYQQLKMQSQPFAASVKAAQNAIDALTAQGINQVVVLSHMGFKKDQQLARALAGADVIVGGDSHTAVKGVMDGLNWVKGKDGKPVLIVQAGNSGQYLGVADLTFDDNGHLTYVGNRLIPTNKYPPMPDIQQYLEQKLGVDAQTGWLEKPVSHTDVGQSAEFRHWLPTQLKQATQADLALVMCSEWKADLPAGPISRWQLDAAFPFNDEPYITATLPAKQVLAHLNRLDGECVLASPVTLKRHPQTGNVMALWSDKHQKWLSGDDPVSMTMNHRLHQRQSGKLSLPTTGAAMVKRHDFTLAQFVGDQLAKQHAKPVMTPHKKTRDLTLSA
jgi:2',3'-cyclic-nucleotide 2'-phosphodiesterase (5'-nucleotidase family)